MKEEGVAHDHRKIKGKVEVDTNVQHVYLCCKQMRVDMKTNITLKLSAPVLRQIRVMAAEEGTSISALLAARLEQIVRERKSYDRSRRRALARLREGMNLGWIPHRSRDELYEW